MLKYEIRYLLLNSLEMQINIMYLASHYIRSDAIFVKEVNIDKNYINRFYQLL